MADHEDFTQEALERGLSTLIAESKTTGVPIRLNPTLWFLEPAPVLSPSVLRETVWWNPGT